MYPINWDLLYANVDDIEDNSHQPDLATPDHIFAFFGQCGGIFGTQTVPPDIADVMDDVLDKIDLSRLTPSSIICVASAAYSRSRYLKNYGAFIARSKAHLAERDPKEFTPTFLAQLFSGFERPYAPLPQARALGEYLDARLAQARELVQLEQDKE